MCHNIAIAHFRMYFYVNIQLKGTLQIMPMIIQNRNRIAEKLFGDFFNI